MQCGLGAQPVSALCEVKSVALLARVVAAGVPHHVNQRGIARIYFLEIEEDRGVYRHLLWKNLELYNVALIGYCLMSNTSASSSFQTARPCLDWR